MITSQDFLVLPVELYRLAGGSDPKLTRLRPIDDVDLYEVNGITMVRANNRGVSLYTLRGVEEVGLTGWAWRIRKGTALPAELKLHNDKSEHYMICPISPMPMAKLVGLLQQMVVHCEKYFSVKVPGVIKLPKQP
jgi:hypothetical protein